MKDEEELLEELPAYADMLELWQMLNSKGIPQRFQHRMANIKLVLEISARLITCDSHIEEEELMESLNQVMR